MGDVEEWKKPIKTGPMIEETPHYRVDSIVFSSSDGSEVRVMLPEEEFERMEAGYSLPRLQFDYMMFKQATELVIGAGGCVIQDFTVKDVVVDDDGAEGSAITGVTGFIGRRKDGVLSSYSSALTIGAAGYNCPVARTITESVSARQSISAGVIGNIGRA